MLEEIFKYCHTVHITVVTRATAEWVEEWGAYQIEAWMYANPKQKLTYRHYSKRGDDIVKLVSDLELYCRAFYEPIELVYSPMEIDK